MADVLRKVVTESLIAHPEDAHLKVFGFLSAAGASETEKVRVQQAWSTVALASEAFGRKKAPIDPVLFGEELIRELASGDKELKRLEGLIASFKTIIAEQSSPGSPAPLSSLADLRKPSGTLASLQSMTKLGKELTAALNATYEAPSSNSSSSGSSSSSSSSRSTAGSNSTTTRSAPGPALVVGNDRAVMEWRRSCRGGKFVWHGRKPAHGSPLFCPLGSSELGGVEVLYGDVVYKNLDTAAGKDPMRPTNVPVIGIKVATKQPSLLARTWTSYHCLHEVANAGNQNMQLFALPFGVQRDAGAGTAANASSVLCAFEMPNCKPLTQMIGAALATFMRRHPSVVLTWCAQLGVAAANLLKCTSGSLVRPPTLSDCFIKDNGQLVVGNVAFSDTSLLSSESGTGGSNDISAFVVKVLATSLALSRTHESALSPSMLPESAQGEPGNYSAMGEEDVVAVMEGCEIRLVFTNHACRGVNLEVLGGKVSKESSSSSSSNLSPPLAVSGTRLSVFVQGESNVAAIAASTAGSAETSVTIKATSPGLLLIQAVSPSQALLQDPTSTGGGRMAATVRIVVVPAYPVMASELQEIIGLVDAAYQSKSNKYVMNAQSVTSQCALTLDETTVARDWTNICRSVADITDPSVSGFSSRLGSSTTPASPTKKGRRV